MKLAWIGLGAMGARMARRVVAAGHEVTVWNRTPSRAAQLVQAGARVADTPAEAAADAEIVFLMLSDPSAVADVCAAPGGIGAHARLDATVVDMSTVGPTSVRELRRQLPAGAVLVDAPVLGSIDEAAAGTLKIFVGGPPEAVGSVMPVLAALGQPIEVGPSGAGAAAKLVANAALLGTIGLLGECLALADRLGLERDVCWDLLAATPLAAQAERRRPMIESGSYPARFRLALARKDADLITAEADSVGADAPIAHASRTWLADAEAAGLGDHDYTAVLGHAVSATRTTSRDEPRAVIFDLDGTLLDTLESGPSVYVDTVRALGGPSLEIEDVLARWHVGPADALLAHFLHRPVGDRELETYFAHLTAAASRMRPFAGIVDMLAALHGAGHRLAVFTSATRRAAAIMLAATGLEHWFAAVVGSDEVARSKPAPDGLLIACRRLGVPLADAVYVGDADTDMECARAAGATGVHAAWGAHPGIGGGPHELVATRPEELAGLMSTPAGSGRAA